MTRLPTESRAVQGVDGPAYELNIVCAKPGCLQQSTDPHHLWRRSELIGAHWWVELPADDAIVGNVVGLCRTHHHQVTINGAWITWNGRGFDWSDMLTSGEPLSFQPPVRPLSNEEPLPDLPEKNGGQPAALAAPFEGSCPTCKRPLPHPKPAQEPKRLRRTWSITVPADERENGAEMLSTLLEEGRLELAKAGLPYGDADSANYFVLSTILGLFVAHAEDVLA